MDIETVVVVGLLCLMSFLLQSQTLSKAIERLDTAFKQAVTNDGFDLDEIKQELANLVEDIIGDMEPPSAVDHLVGMVSQFAQLKMMKSMEESGLADVSNLIAEGLNES